MKAIETEYNGYLFRSRLEARWAVFFDTLGIEYQYEKEGIELENGERYLPDFWLPNEEVWVEIKPEKPCLDEPGVREYELCEALARESGKIVWIIGGDPGYKDIGIPGAIGFTYAIAVFSPDMFVPNESSSPNGIEPKFWVSNPKQICRLDEWHYISSRGLYGFLYRHYGDQDGFPERGEAHKLIEWDRKYYWERHGAEHPLWHYGIADYELIFEDVDPAAYYPIKLGARLSFECSERVRLALGEARQARFEHGQVGGPSEWHGEEIGL